MKLYDLPQRADPKPKIYCTIITADGVTKKDAVVLFDHLDGAYSLCYLEDSGKNGEPVDLIHLSASTPLVPYKDGYKIEDEDE